MINISAPALPLSRPLSFYLAMEEWVASNMPPGEYMFTWIVDRSVIFGRNQVAHLEADLDYCRDHGIAVYRRRSGGGCVYADPANLMVSHITTDTNVERVFARYLGRMATALRSLCADVQPSGRNDLMLGQHKVSGNAFYRMASRSIVHGTLLWQADTATMARAITPSRSKLLSHKVKSVGARVTGLSQVLPHLTLHDVDAHLCKSMCDSVVTLTNDQICDITATLQPRYHDPAWTIGHRDRTADGTVVKLPTVTVDGAGTFDVTLLLRSGLIAGADITGDYFLLSDIDTGIIDHIRGARPDRESLARALAGTDTSGCIAGLSTPRLISILSDSYNALTLKPQQS